GGARGRRGVAAGRTARREAERRPAPRLPAARGAPRDPRPHRPRPHRQPRSGRTLDRARPGGPAASELTAAPQRGGFRQGEVGSGPVAVAVEVGAARRAGAVTVTVTVVDG